MKADANPGVDNVAYTTPEHTGGFTVRCNELCGIWHGAMFDYGRVITPSAFQTWARDQRGDSAAERACWPRCRRTRSTYDPTVIPQLGQGPDRGRDHRRSGYYYPPRIRCTP